MRYARNYASALESALLTDLTPVALPTNLADSSLPFSRPRNIQDCEDSNPLIRALAVRTMGCIRVDKITEYLCEPLRKCLKDEDPYVRKTAAVCVAKLYDISSSMVCIVRICVCVCLRAFCFVYWAPAVQIQSDRLGKC